MVKMGENQQKPIGMEKDWLRNVCWRGDDNARWCRYVRFYKGAIICAKGTAAGIRHSQRIDRMLEEERKHADQIVFTSGSDTDQDYSERKMRLHAGDNCLGRAGEFLHLLSSKDVS